MTTRKCETASLSCTPQSFKRRPDVALSLFVAAPILVAVHAALLVFDPRVMFLSNLFILMYPLMGVTVCLIGAHRDTPETRSLWLLFGCGLFIAVVGQLGLMYDDFTTPVHTQTQALNSDFFFFAYAIPVMLAICSRTKDAGLKIFAWLDGAQALIAAILAYLQLFSVLPSHARPEAISATNLMYLNNAENLILVGAVTLRFFSNPSPARRLFYRRLLSLSLGQRHRRSFCGLLRAQGRLAWRTARCRMGHSLPGSLGLVCLETQDPNPQEGTE